MSKKDYYKVLGVSATASAQEIKKAYKRLAKQHHPDCNQGDKCAEDKFKEISEAYGTLSDPEKRRQYDMYREGGPIPPGGGQWTGAPGSGSSHAWTSGPGGQGFDAGGQGFDAGDLFGGGGGIGDIFSEIFGGGRGGSRRVDFRGGHFAGDYDIGPEPGRDVEAELTISFDDAIQGGVKRFQVRRSGACKACGGSGRSRAGASRTCAVCNGRGRRQVANAGANVTVVCGACAGAGKVFTDPCASCQGTGRAGGLETISVKIPPGVKDGGRLRIPGKGEAGPDGSTGDLFIHIRVTPHPYFRRDGDNLHLDLPVTLSEAVLGARVEVPTLEGTAGLKVPAGTQNGAVLRLKGKGAPCPKGGGKGDLYLHVQVTIPKDLDDRARKLLEELKEHEQDPRAGKF